jgi:aspartate ammonia-lyase
LFWKKDPRLLVDVTALNPYIGYERSTIVADEGQKTGRSVYEIVLEKGYLSKVQLDEILSPENRTRPRYLHGQ